MNGRLDKIKTEVYDICGLTISNFKVESESKEYDACQFDLNGVSIISRAAKITPKKVGQFVTFWKRNKEGITVPFDEHDQFDFYVVNVFTENNFGQFIFPKSILINKGIVSTNKKDGKRGFRIYAIWDSVNNPQSKKNQKWQLDYFSEIGEMTDFKRVKELYKLKSI